MQFDRLHVHNFQESKCDKSDNIILDAQYM